MLKEFDKSRTWDLWARLKRQTKQSTVCHLFKCFHQKRKIFFLSILPCWEIFSSSFFMITRPTSILKYNGCDGKSSFTDNVQEGLFFFVWPSLGWRTGLPSSNKIGSCLFEFTLCLLALGVQQSTGKVDNFGVCVWHGCWSFEIFQMISLEPVYVFRFDFIFVV